MAAVKEALAPTRRARRAAETRRRIVAAARSQFESHGFEGARIEDMAAEADVSVATVYKVFGTKAALLEAALDAAMTGSANDRVERQAWWQEQLEEPDARRQLALIARNARRIYERAGVLLQVARTAAANDRGIAALWRRINDERLERSRSSMARLAAKKPLRSGLTVSDAALTIWSLTGPELYSLRVGVLGRSPRDYERWLADLLIAALLSDLGT